MSLRIEWIGDEHAFGELAPAWDRLNAEGHTPFDSHRWYAAWWRAFGSPGSLAVATAWRDDRLAAVFPLRRRWGRRLEAMANVHSPLYRPVGDPAAVEFLVDEVFCSDASAVELVGLPGTDPVLGLLGERGRAARRRELVEPSHVSPIVDTTGTFDAWRRLTRPQWQADLDRYKRNLGRRHSGEFSLVEPPRDLEGELRAGYHVEASGWKGERGTAIVSAPETEVFYSEVAARFHQRGELRLSRITLPAGDAAFDLCLLHDRRLYLLKTGFDERFRKLAPGLVLRLATIERCFELGLEAHELLGDYTDWKRKFSTSARAHSSCRYYRHRPLSLSRWVYRSAIRPRLSEVSRRTRRRVARRPPKGG